MNLPSKTYEELAADYRQALIQPTRLSDLGIRILKDTPGDAATKTKLISSRIESFLALLSVAPELTDNYWRICYGGYGSQFITPPIILLLLRPTSSRTHSS